MAKGQGNVWISPPPPPAVLRAMNVVMKPLLTSAAGKRMKGVMLLEFSGRRSGKAFKVPVNCHLVDGVPMAFTDRPWRLNFKGGAPAKVTYRGQVRHTTGTLVPMTAEEMGSRFASPSTMEDPLSGWAYERLLDLSRPRPTSPPWDRPSGRR